MGEILDIVTGRIPGLNGKTPEQPKGDPAFEGELAAIRKEKVKGHLVNELMKEDDHRNEHAEAGAFTALSSLAAAREKSNTDIITTLLTRLLDASGKSPSIAADPYVQRLERDLVELKNSQQNPFEVYGQVQTALGQFAASMGLTREKQAPQPAVTDAAMTLQLRQMELAAEERRQQWQAEMEERRRAWEREDRRWQEEFKLKKIEMFDKKDVARERGEMFGDLLGALSQNITVARTGEPISQSPPSRGPGFECSECERWVPVDATAKTAECGTCHTVYSLTQEAAA